MSRREIKSLGQMADEVLESVSATDRRKQAELAVVKVASVGPKGEIGEMVTKLASMVRTRDTSVSYDDLNAYIRGQA